MASHTANPSDVEPVGNGQNALRYLSRYLYRVALTDAAILAHDDQTVTFRYRESDTGKTRTMVLPVMEFIRRFLQHVLPSGFVKVRHYGLHHPARRAALSLARAALCLRLNLPLPDVPPPALPKPCLCPRCAAPMVLVERIPRSRATRARAPPP